MKRTLTLLVMTFFPATSFAGLNVVASIPTFGALAQEVGGNLIDVKSLAKGDQDPHFLEPKPSYTVLLNRADLVIEGGLELEIGWMPVLLTQSRNPKIQRGQPGYLDASDGLSIQELPTGKMDRSEGDVHPLGNPHYWMDPRNGLIIARHIATRLKQLDPKNAEQYDKNYQQFELRLKGKIAGWDKKLAPLRGQKIITYHKSLSYFSNWSGINVAGYVEPKPGIPPNPGYLLSLIDKIKTEKIPLIASENFYNPKPCEQLAEKTGAKFITITTSVNGEPAVKSYDDLIEVMIQKFLGAL